MLEIQLFLSLMIAITILNTNFRSFHQVKEFRINDYLKLKLEGGRTNIYVKERLFRQCMYLLLNIPVNRIEEYDEIESIDEAAEKLDRSMERNFRLSGRISPEEEFIGHCSNLQAWAENGYDTRILYRNLAFPLLKRLTEAGDPIANKVFKEEIAIRYASGHPTVTRFLTQNGYLKYLSAEEFESIIDEISPTFLEDVIEELKYIFEQTQNSDSNPTITYLINALLRNFGIEHISLIICKILKEIPENYRENLVKSVYNLFKTRKRFPRIQYINQYLEYFKGFEFEFEFIKYEGNLIGVFKNNKIYLRHHDISVIADIEGFGDKLEKIEELDLSDNQITEMNGIERFSNLKCLKLNNNRITNINGLENLKNLQKLFLRNNKISEIKGLENLRNLKHLELSGNTNITEIPESLNELPALKNMKLWDCKIKKFSDSTSKFFWMNQNYRYYSAYTQKDKEYYERTHNSLASSNNKLYKHFVQWVFKMRELMKEENFSHEDIEKFENEISKNAIWSGRATNDFKKWLSDKSQTKITSFL